MKLRKCKKKRKRNAMQIIKVTLKYKDSKHTDRPLSPKTIILERGENIVKITEDAK